MEVDLAERSASILSKNSEDANAQRAWALIVRETRDVAADELDNPALRAKEHVVRAGASPFSQLLKEGYSDDVKAVLALVQAGYLLRR